MRVVVTGANGFVAVNVMKHLKLRGCEVIGWSRSISSTNTDYEIKNVNYDDVNSMTVALTGVEAVVHLAGVAHARDMPSELYRTAIYNLTSNIWTAAKAAGVSSFVYASSIKVYGEDRPNELLKEGSRCTPTTDYGIQKKNTEDYLIEQARRGQTPRLTIFRMPPIYGLGTRGVVRHLILCAKLRLPLPIQGLRIPRSFLSVENFCLFIEAAIESRLPSGVLNPIDSPPMYLGELYRRIFIDIHGHWPSWYSISLPASLLKFALRFLGMTSALETLALGSLYSEHYKQFVIPTGSSSHS